MYTAQFGARFESVSGRVCVSAGTLKFGKIDVTEEQFCVISLYMIGALFGSDVWNTEVRSPLAGAGQHRQGHNTGRDGLSGWDGLSQARKVITGALGQATTDLV